MPRISLEDTELNVLDQGHGPTVLLVHGFPVDHRMWRKQTATLSQTHRVIAPDLRGFGESPATTGVISMTQFADDLADLLEQMEVAEPIVFCGLSMGGYIAWQFAHHYPEKLRGLILCDTKATADSEAAVATRHDVAEKVIADGPEFLSKSMPSKIFSNHSRAEHPELVEFVQQMIRDASPNGIAAASWGMSLRPDMTELLPTISVATLVVVGEDDELTSPSEMQTIAESIPNGKAVVVPQAGHMAPLEQPAIVNDAIINFLQSL
ncbi:alpha/beta fold hydrolase [Thalassoroseus pseudoceratinae]|uniref:alpha/beta fold hydrolase n=1 Tax=Thalassoroseus pseudoceratinae TaxID=2713176 RepID=UPI0014204E6F|nr:alpha/beta fold hydrolase [Thalassoroseus pseudoceratinae]